MFEVFRLRHRTLGAHVHVRVFQRKPPSETWQKNGDLVFDVTGWLSWLRTLSLASVAGAVEVLPEDDALDETTLIPDCECRHCGHPASKHRGEQGACAVPGCDCGPGGWT